MLEGLRPLLSALRCAASQIACLVLKTYAPELALVYECVNAVLDDAYYDARGPPLTT